MAEKKEATHKAGCPKPNAPKEEKDKFVKILDNYIKTDKEIEDEIKEESVV